MNIDIKGAMSHAHRYLEKFFKMMERVDNGEIEACDAWEQLIEDCGRNPQPGIAAFTCHELGRHVVEIETRLAAGDDAVIKEFFDLYCIKTPTGSRFIMKGEIGDERN